MRRRVFSFVCSSVPWIYDTAGVSPCFGALCLTLRAVGSASVTRIYGTHIIIVHARHIFACGNILLVFSVWGSSNSGKKTVRSFYDVARALGGFAWNSGLHYSELKYSEREWNSSHKGKPYAHTYRQCYCLMQLYPPTFHKHARTHNHFRSVLCVSFVRIVCFVFVFREGLNFKYCIRFLCV